MIQMIMAAIENDTVVVPIVKTWLLGFISLWVMGDIDSFFKVLVAISVIIYTTLKSMNAYEDNKEKRNNRKNHDKDNHRPNETHP